MLHDVLWESSSVEAWGWEGKQRDPRSRVPAQTNAVAVALRLLKRCVASKRRDIVANDRQASHVHAGLPPCDSFMWLMLSSSCSEELGRSICLPCIFPQLCKVLGRAAGARTLPPSAAKVPKWSQAPMRLILPQADAALTLPLPSKLLFDDVTGVPQFSALTAFGGATRVAAAERAQTAALVRRRLVFAQTLPPAPA